ncbi:MAG: ABC transporter ATP-binding protein [bacterium]|jgi:ABC-2 type transport system ATP-binding protein
MAIIAIHNLSKWYGEVIGVSHVTCEIHPGVTGLLGPNGAGKTTFFKLISGLIRADTGSIAVDGQPVWNNPSIFQTIGYCPSIEKIYETMTGLEFLMYMARLNGMSRSAARARALECLEQMDLSHAVNKSIGAYSKGMRQRVKFAQALIHDPEVLYFDEPLSGMDPIGRLKSVELIRRLGQEGRTILVSSHILEEVEDMTHQIMLLNNGMLLAEGDVLEIRELLEEQPRHVQIQTPDRRLLSNLLVQFPEVQTISFGDEPDLLIVMTTEADSFYPRLNQIVLEKKIPIHEVVTLDDNLQSVFDYLVK